MAEMDLDEAERRLRYWIKTTNVLPWYFANELERHFVEYDRRGAALADAQAEIARLRAAVEAVRELCQGKTFQGTDVILLALAAAPAPAEDEPKRRRGWRDWPDAEFWAEVDAAGGTGLLDPAPAPAREQADPAEGGDRG